MIRNNKKHLRNAQVFFTTLAASETFIHTNKQRVREFQCLESRESRERAAVSHRENREQRFLVSWEENKGIKVEIPTLGFPLWPEHLRGKWISCKS